MNVNTLVSIYEIVSSDFEYAEARLDCVTKEYQSTRGYPLPPELEEAYQQRILRAKEIRDKAAAAMADFEAKEWVEAPTKGGESQ